MVMTLLVIRSLIQVYNLMLNYFNQFVLALGCIIHVIQSMKLIKNLIEVALFFQLTNFKFLLIVNT